MFPQHTLFAAATQSWPSPLYSFLPENMRLFLASPIVDLGSLLGLGLAVILLFVLNRHKKKLIASTSRMLEETEGHYHLLFNLSPLPLMVGDYSTVKTFLDGLPDRDRADLEQYFAKDPVILDRCAAGVWILDANRAALQTYKVDKPEQLSRLLTTMPGEEKDPFLQELIQLLHHGTSEVQVHNRISNGETLTLLRRTVLAAEAETSWERVFVALIDITEALRLRKENQAFERQLQEGKKLEMLGNISGGIAHDFNNILSPILSHSELLLLKEADPQAVRKHGQAIVDASIRAKKLIQQILTFSCQVGQEFRPLSLDSLVREVIELVEPTLSETITLSYSATEDRPLVLADATQLHQVLMNVVTNALHAMEDCGGCLNLRLDVLHPEAMDDGEKALLRKTVSFQRLRIVDTGCGMDEAILARIFDQHFTTKPWGKGTGLGLANVLEILRGCGGEIQVRSAPGQGSVFTLYFPLFDKISGADQGLLEEQSIHHALPQGLEHILLVDDEKSIAEVMAAMLEPLGYRVTIRTNPHDALQFLAAGKEHFDLLLVDMDMPEINGLDFCRKVHELQMQTKVIVCTGFTDQETEEAFHYLGINAFVQKPVLLADLSWRIRTVLDQNQYAD